MFARLCLCHTAGRVDGRQQERVTIVKQRALNGTSGDHAAQVMASSLDDLRDFIARRFATDIAAATPRACAWLQGQAGNCADAGERAALIGAARLLSLERQVLTTRIEHGVRARFDAKKNCPNDTISHTGQFSMDALSLIEELGMQDEFELEHHVGLLRDHCHAELRALSAHLRDLLGRASLPEAQNPAFPRVLLRALMDAIDAIGENDSAEDARVGRAAFRAYGPELCGIVRNLYARANALIDGAGKGVKVEFDDSYGHVKLVPMPGRSAGPPT